jgi:hypothetical protein
MFATRPAIVALLRANKGSHGPRSVVQNRTIRSCLSSTPVWLIIFVLPLKSTTIGICVLPYACRKQKK